ncbi:KH domain-containing protein [Granulicella rosea]|uniref:KH domain-containing protein n=1 Tax=Granulicella rosea TaxID=474952 RepID=UPI002481E611|nr:KH domain-containing protein [Granulicella rosea]
MEHRASLSVTTLSIYVALTDAGKIIGKQGRTARSLRTIMSAVGMKRQQRYALNIEGNNGSSPTRLSHASRTETPQR